MTSVAYRAKVEERYQANSLIERIAGRNSGSWRLVAHPEVTGSLFTVV
jgi:hypothetical protein